MDLNSNNPSEENSENKPQEDNPTSGPVADLTRVIQESKAKIADEMQPPKRGRGRPKGSTSKPRRPSPTPEPNSSITDSAPLAEPQAPTPSFAPILAKGIQIPFSAKARKTGFEGWKMPDDEALGHAQLLDQALATYLPDLSEQNPKLLVLLTCAASLGMAFVARSMEYDAYLEAEGKKNQPEAESEQAPPKPLGPAIDAMNFFPQVQT